MNRDKARFVSAALLAGFGLSMTAVQAQATPNTPEQRAVEAAKKGPTELRRFIHRTRMIYGLHFNDFYKA